MAGKLGKYGKFFVKAGEIDVTALSNATLKTELASAKKDDTVSATGWYEVCLVDVNRGSQKQTVDATDRCSGPLGDQLAGTPSTTIDIKSYQKDTLNKWEEVVQAASDSTTTAGSIVTIAMLNGDSQAAGTRGWLFTAVISNDSEAQALNSPMESNYQFAVSGLQYTTSSRRVTIA